MVMPESTPTEKKDRKESVMHSFGEGKSSASFFTSKLLIFVIVASLLGVGTGYYLARNGGDTGIESLDKVTKSSNIEKGKTYGDGDSATFSDTAEGEVSEGGVNGEGSHHLIRPGGESQNVYMTSSLVDLSQFEGRKVKVWGATQKAQNVGWLMDVGKVEVLD